MAGSETCTVLLAVRPVSVFAVSCQVPIAEREAGDVLLEATTRRQRRPSPSLPSFHFMTSAAIPTRARP